MLGFTHKLSLWWKRSIGRKFVDRTFDPPSVDELQKFFWSFGDSASLEKFLTTPYPERKGDPCSNKTPLQLLIERGNAGYIAQLQGALGENIWYGFILSEPVIQGIRLNRQEDSYLYDDIKAVLKGHESLREEFIDALIRRAIMKGHSTALCALCKSLSDQEDTPIDPSRITKELNFALDCHTKAPHTAAGMVKELLSTLEHDKRIIAITTTLGHAISPFRRAVLNENVDVIAAFHASDIPSDGYLDYFIENPDIINLAIMARDPEVLEAVICCLSGKDKTTLLENESVQQWIAQACSAMSRERARILWGDLKDTTAIISQIVKRALPLGDQMVCVPISVVRELFAAAATATGSGSFPDVPAATGTDETPATVGPDGPNPK